MNGDILQWAKECAKRLECVRLAGALAAIDQWREAQATLKEMQRLSRSVLFETVPHPPRRKKLGKKVLGTM
jgi:hypothetical protein